MPSVALDKAVESGSEWPKIFFLSQFDGQNQTSAIVRWLKINLFLNIMEVSIDWWVPPLRCQSTVVTCVKLRLPSSCGNGTVSSICTLIWGLV